MSFTCFLFVLFTPHFRLLYLFSAPMQRDAGLAAGSYLERTRFAAAPLVKGGRSRVRPSGRTRGANSSLECTEKAHIIDTQTRTVE